MKKPPLLFEDRAPDAGLAFGRTSILRGIVLVGLVFFGTRLVTWTGAYYGAFTLWRIEQKLMPPFERHIQRWAREGTDPDSAEYRSAMKFLADFSPLCRFDGAHYRSIIEGGYAYAPPPPSPASHTELEQNIAFFPLYPLICRPLTSSLTVPAAMILASHVCALAAAVVLYSWVRWRIDERAGLFAVAAAFCLPPACYYSFAYAESLTLLLVVSALWLIDRRSWVPAAIVCGLATATRPTALALTGVYALAYWFNSAAGTETSRHNDHNLASRRRRLVRLAPLLVVAAAGILCYTGYLTVRFGSPLVYLANFRAGWVTDEGRAGWLEYLVLARVWDQFKYFGRALLSLPTGLVHVTNPLMWNMPLNLFILFLSLAGLGRVPRSFRPLLALGPLVFLHAYLASGGATFGVEPIARYMLVAAPATVVLAAWCTRQWHAAARHALLAFMLLLQGAWAFRFGMQEWSG